MIPRTQGFEHYTKGYNDLKKHIQDGWSIDWLVGPPRSGTNTVVNMLAEIPEIDGLHLRDAFYHHQGLIITEEEHFDIICGIIAGEIDKRITKGDPPHHILIKDMPQLLSDELFDKWLDLISNFFITYRDPHYTMASLITALSNDTHIKNTPIEAGIIKSRDLFSMEEHEELLNSTIEQMLSEHSDLKYGHWNNMNVILERITQHIELHPDKKMSIFDFSMVQANPSILAEAIENTNLTVPQTLSGEWSKSVGSNFNGVSASQFSKKKFPPKSDPRKDKIWERNALYGPFKLMQADVAPDNSIFPEEMRSILLNELVCYYIDVLRHPCVVGPKSEQEFINLALKEIPGTGLIKDIIPVTLYAYGIAQGLAPQEFLSDLRRDYPKHEMAFNAIDNAINATPELTIGLANIQTVHTAKNTARAR